MAKTCNHCKIQNPDDAHYCANCGKPFESAYILVQKSAYNKQLEHIATLESEVYTLKRQNYKLQKQLNTAKTETGNKPAPTPVQYKVNLNTVDSSKILNVIITIQQITGKTWREAQKLVDKCRNNKNSETISIVQSLAEAEKIKKLLEDKGASIIIEKQ